MRRRKGDAAADVGAAIFDWAASLDLRRWYGAGRVEGSCYFGQEDEHGYLRLFALATYGRVIILLGEMATGKHPSFEPEHRRRELLIRINTIFGTPMIPDDKISLYPSIPFTALTDPDRLHEFFGVMAWALDEMKKTQQEPDALQRVVFPDSHASE